MVDKDGVLAKLHEEVCIVKSAEDLSVGDIIYVELDQADGINTQGYPTRLKYVVVSGAKSDRKQIAAVLINSENDYSNDPEWQKEQYLLSQKNYANFLEYDSWLDCFEIKELKVRKIVARKAEKKGRLNTYDLCIMMQKLKDSEFIDEHLKKVYGINSFKVPEV
ncbi:MAG: hypothetical protein IJ734_07520 [Fibrobacter sp.]|nr:hypothetical protein [Fibrobacter sp.]